MSVWPALETPQNEERQLNAQHPSQTACYKILWTRLKIRNGDAMTKNYCRCLKWLNGVCIWHIKYFWNIVSVCMKAKHIKLTNDHAATRLMTKVYNKSDVFSQHGNPCDSAHLRVTPLCPEHYTLSWSEVNLRQHPWVRTTAPSSLYLSVTVNDAVKSVYLHQACTFLHIYSVISPSGLVLSTTLTGFTKS